MAMDANQSVNCGYMLVSMNQIPCYAELANYREIKKGVNRSGAVLKQSFVSSCQFPAARSVEVGTVRSQMLVHIFLYDL